MILLIDNYDSFVHNLARYLCRLGHRTEIVRNDAISVGEIVDLQPAAIVLSPGPCTPREAGCSLDVVRELYQQFPILGVCLGHQAIAEAFGATIIRAHEPMHGRISSIEHIDSPLFHAVPSPFPTCRYHSLVADREAIPSDLEVTASTDDGTVMAVEHRTYPVCGVQFHPEAILSGFGYQILANFLYLAGLRARDDVQHLAETEMRVTRLVEPLSPRQPITF